MAGEPKAKVIIGADTAEFNKGIKAAKADMKSFGTSSEEILSKLGQLLGLDTRQVEQMASSIRGFGQTFGKAGSEGEGALNKIASAAKGAGASIAAIGIGAAIASFKILNEEASAFKNTIAGANIELQTKAYIDTYRQVFHDFNAGAAQNVAEWEAGWQKGFARWKANFSQTVTNVFTGNTDWVTAIGGPILGSFFGNRDQKEAANAAAERASQIAKELYDLSRQQSDQTRTIADLDKEIAENKEIMRNDQNDLNVRIAAYEKIVAAITQKEQLLLPIEQRRTELMDEMVSLSASSPAAVDAANQQYVRQAQIARQLTDEKTALLRYSNGLYNREAKITEEMKRQRELLEQIKASRAETAAWLAQSGAPSLNVQQFATTSAQGGGIILPEINPIALQEQINSWIGDSLYLEVGININKGSILDMSRQVESILGGLAESMSSAIGGLVGDLVTGGDAWSNFANAALAAFGDMAISVGKIAIEAGIATLGIKAALATLGPAGAAMAIGAGSALVLLGSAVKAGMSNVANGNYSASTGVASSGYGTAYGDGFETREVEIKVTGNLVADGNQLKAVINNVDKQNGYTT